MVIDELPPSPDKDSGSITAVEFLRSLNRLGLQVTFFPRCQLNTVDAYMLDLQAEGIEVLYEPHVNNLEETFSRYSGIYDVVVLFRLSVGANLIDSVRKLSPASKIIYHTVDLHFLRTERERSLKEVDRQRVELELDIRSLELGVIARSDVTVVVSEEEQRILGRILPMARVVNLPYVIDVRPGNAEFEKRKDFLFLGGFTYQPNVDAVLYFVREIFPLVQEELPGAKFLVVGNAPPPEIQCLASDRIEVTGYVPDLNPWFERCKFSVSPLRYGAGIKGKVVMSMSRGVPCITTSIAAEGMGAEEGDHLLVADKSDDFADCMLTLYKNKELWRVLSNNSIEFVRNRYSPEAGDRTMRTILNIIPEF